VAAPEPPAASAEPVASEPVSIEPVAGEAAPAPKARPKRASKPKAAPKAKKPAEAPAEPATAAAAEPATEPEAVVEAGAGDASGLVEPLPGYSGLTVASLRARMRGKSVEQMGDLLAYEQATTARPEVIRMYENRLAKLEAPE
jgi:hypothetical protein